MKWFRNMQITGKLICGFATVIVFAVILAAVSIVTVNSIDGNYSYVLDHPQQRLLFLNNVKTEYINMRRLTVTIGLYGGDMEKINSLKPELEEAYKNACDNIDSYIQKSNTDSKQMNEILEKNIDNAQTLKNEITGYKTQIADQVVTYALEDNETAILNAIENGKGIIENANGIVQTLVDSAINFTTEISDSSTEAARKSVWTVIILSAVIVSGSMLIAFVIAAIIVRPIKKLVDITDNLAKGNLNVNSIEPTKDEIGVLVKNFFVVINELKSLVDGLNEMGKQHHLGDIDVYIDEGVYVGSYKEVASSINRMVSEHINAKKTAIACIAEIVDGNFSAPLVQFPGKKVFINEAVEHLRKSLRGINNEIDAMIKSTVAGNLSYRIDVKEYNGDWVKVMSGLNEVLSAVALPIQESLEVIQEMAKGNFKATMKGNYNGDFNAIKSSVNVTVKNISEYIKEISAVLDELANDNLDLEITKNYVGEFMNIKNSLNSIITKLNHVMNEIGSASWQVAEGARQISDSSMMLAQGATEQAAAVDELNATVMSVDEKTQLNNQNAAKAEELSNQSKANAFKGNEEMKNMLGSMEEIKESSNNISKIIKVIDDIAFQTNLLALNAAVEAARAGQHGKGFAVVAEEVRSLAARSQTAARETTALIENSIQKVNEGTEIAKATAGALEKIVFDVTEVSTIIDGISSASNEQATAVSQINIGVQQIAEVVQSNSATSEESASSAEELSSQSDVLRSMIQAFHLKK